MTGFDFLIFGFFSFHVFAGENHQCFVDIIMNFTKLDALYESRNHFFTFKNYQLCGRQIASNSLKIPEFSIFLLFLIFLDDLEVYTTTGVFSIL